MNIQLVCSYHGCCILALQSDLHVLTILVCVDKLSLPGSTCTYTHTQVLASEGSHVFFLACAVDYMYMCMRVTVSTPLVRDCL